MAPIVKDVENSAVTTAPAAPVTKPPQDGSATRPQPVALEIPVTVNGARTVDGSDKREPFSESTKTVLVFGHGAVIRLASQVAPGQLLFVTNEKTKKEVVCQVVKSKNYRTVTGYVELEFTEPAAAFWGMRFPAEKVAPVPGTSATPAAPVAQTSVPRPVAPITPAHPTPVPPKSAAIPPAPPVIKPPAPAPVATKPASVAPQAAPPALAKVEPPKPTPSAESHPASHVAPPPTPAAPPSQVHATPIVAPPSPVSIKPEPIRVPEVRPVPVPPAATSATIETKSVASEATKPVPSIPPANQTTEELKQQTARLQEQLGSLLFTETPEAKQPAQEKTVVPKPEIIPTETVQKILRLTQADVKPSSPPVMPVPETKPTTTTLKPVSVSMAVEEVKIPAWLAPLAREADNNTVETPVEEAAVSEVNSSSDSSTADALFSDAQAASTKALPTMFGGQLLGTSSASSEVSASGGSKKGLFIGIAAAGILLIGAGVWYAKQPGNALSGLLAPKSATAQAQIAQNSPSPSTSLPAFRTETEAPAGPASTSSKQPVAAKPLTPAPVPVTGSAANSNPIPAVVKEATTAPRNTPPVEQPKKPALGDVRLAAPNVNRAANSTDGNDAAPSIDADQLSSGEPMVSLPGSHPKEPSAPLPIGGDVQPAKLLKSVPPIYPPAARTQRISGDVKIDALIDASGNVSTMKVLSGPALLHQAAMTALKQWKYEPAKLDGNPTQMHLIVTVQFRLQ